MHRAHPQHLLEHQGPRSVLVHRQLKASDLIFWLLRRRSRFRVQGASMLPEYAEGDQVLVNPHAWKHRQPKPRDVVLLEHPHSPGLYIIKRISHIDEAGRYFVLGDNPTHSTDSREFGPVQRYLLVGEVVGKLA
ncbi:MAG: nickel-type superoxide dismutase maturation protease [Myxococcota bacterium]|nr:nickel-type superoxide dismutase maturation protease [Myxococcota bacterium]